jgi:hypothetical protein
LTREHLQGNQMTLMVGEDDFQSMRRMMMEATKRARVERAMVMAMRVAGNKKGIGNNKKDGVSDEGGVQQRGRWQQLQEQSQQG